MKKSAEENFARIYDFNFGILRCRRRKEFLIFRKSCVGENGASDEETSPRNPINVDLFSIIFAFDDKFPAINLELRERKKFVFEASQFFNQISIFLHRKIYFLVIDFPVVQFLQL